MHSKFLTALQEAEKFDAKYQEASAISQQELSEPKFFNEPAFLRMQLKEEAEYLLRQMDDATRQLLRVKEAIESYEAKTAQYRKQLLHLENPAVKFTDTYSELKTIAESPENRDHDLTEIAHAKRLLKAADCRIELLTNENTHWKNKEFYEHYAATLQTHQKLLEKQIPEHRDRLTKLEGSGMRHLKNHREEELESSAVELYEQRNPDTDVSRMSDKSLLRILTEYERQQFYTKEKQLKKVRDNLEFLDLASHYVAAQNEKTAVSEPQQPLTQAMLDSLRQKQTSGQLTSETLQATRESLKSCDIASPQKPKTL